MKKLTVSIFLFISILSSSIGQNVNVTSLFDSSEIYIGDQIKYTITIEQPANLKLTLPLFKDTLCKNIEILSGPKVDTLSVQNGRIKIIQKYLITSYDSGLYQLTPVFAETKDADGMKRFYSDYTRLEVLRIKIAPADTAAKIFDIIRPYKAPVTMGEVLPYLLIAVLLGTATWLAIRYIRKHKKAKKGIETFIPSDPAHVIAFRELEKLRNEELWQKGETKKYYTKLTEILRQYLENRFRVYSLELTTAETLEVLVKTGFKKDGSYNNLKTVLTGADLVKFAKYNPVPSENEIHFKNSWNFVLATKEIELITSDDVEKNSVQEGNI
jgi:hypothetical protein